ncbi:MAG TPA: hypothetical protein VFW30_08415 [Bryocella sp.]|nr:hypothetical protein [Bryocella sp.]
MVFRYANVYEKAVSLIGSGKIKFEVGYPLPCHLSRVCKGSNVLQYTDQPM